MSMYIGGDKIDALYVKKTLSPGDTISYNDLTDKPFIPTAVTDLSDASNYALKTDIQTYTAGTGINITNGVISNTQTSAEWGNITGVLSTQSDLQSALDSKIDGSSLATVATSGDYNDLVNKPTMPEGLPSQSGQSGKYLTTNGTTASWTTVTIPSYDTYPQQNSTNYVTSGGIYDKKYISNSATNNMGNSLLIYGDKTVINDTSSGFNVFVGIDSGQADSDGNRTTNITNNGMTTIGQFAVGRGNYIVALGYGSKALNTYSTALGYQAITTAESSIQLGRGTNSEANSFYVGLSNSNNYKLLGSDGKIPDDRLNTTIARTSDYYTKAEVDAMIGNIESILQRLNSGNN